MLYSLSTDVIIDTIHALAAMQMLSSSVDERKILAPLLDNDRRGTLVLLVKNAFAETMLDILPYVENADLDGEIPSESPGHQPPDDGADHLLQIELRVDKTGVVVRPSVHGLVRRGLESVIVMRVLESVALAASGNGASALSACFGAKTREAISSLLSVLSAPGAPLMRKPFVL